MMAREGRPSVGHLWSWYGADMVYTWCGVGLEESLQRKGILRDIRVD